MDNTIPHSTPRRKKLTFDIHKSNRVNARINDTGNVGAHYQEDTTVIYGLVDPRDRQVFYIGLTNNLYLRFKQHMLMTGENTRKQDRIQAILDARMLPWMLTLEVVDDDVSPREREIGWIQAYLNSGVELLNDEAQEGA